MVFYVLLSMVGEWAARSRYCSKLVAQRGQADQAWIDVVVGVAVSRILVLVCPTEETESATVRPAERCDRLGQRDRVPDGAAQIQLVVLIEPQDIRLG